MALIKCRECGKEISSDAKKCPHCGKKRPMSAGGKMFLTLIAFFVVLVIVPWKSIVPQGGSTSSTSASSDDFRKKALFVKALDEATYKEMGVFNKVDFGTTDRIEITLDIRNKTIYGLAKKLAPKCKEAGFKVLRIKDTHSDRYEDFKL